MQNQPVDVVVVQLFKGVKRYDGQGFRASYMCSKLWFISFMSGISSIHNFQRWLNYRRFDMEILPLEQWQGLSKSLIISFCIAVYVVYFGD